MVKYAIYCEMVGSGNRSILARVSIVNENGDTVLDDYVKPTAYVSDYRTCVSGIKRAHLDNGQDFATVQQKVKSLINGCILIGHSLHYDLDALDLSHPEHNRRDLAKYEPFKRPSLLSQIKGRVLEPSLHFELDAMGRNHPEHTRRDLAKCEPFRRLFEAHPASLQFLVRQYLGRWIQEGEHDSLQDAKDCMDIYRKVSSEWERLY